MSADNGVYILKSPVVMSDPYRECRVLHCSAIDNIRDGDGWNLAVIWEMFGQCEPLPLEAARNKAFELLNKLPVCEYGIREINMNRPFPTAREAVEYNITELEVAFHESGVVNDDRPVTGRQLTKVKFALIDALKTMALAQTCQK
jgi:hypothetical protein